MLVVVLVLPAAWLQNILMFPEAPQAHFMLCCIATLEPLCLTHFPLISLYQVYSILHFAQQRNGTKILSDISTALTLTVEDFTCSFETSIKLHFFITQHLSNHSFIEIQELIFFIAHFGVLDLRNTAYRITH